MKILTNLPRVASAWVFVSLMSFICPVFGEYTVDDDGKTSPVSTLEDLQKALVDPKVETVVLAPPAASSAGAQKAPPAALVLPDGTELRSEGGRKVVQVVEPFLPEDGTYVSAAAATVLTSSRPRKGNIANTVSFTSKRERPSPSKI